MRPAELLLRYQHLEERVRTLDDERLRLEDRLINDPQADRLQVQLAEAAAAHQHALKRLESMDRDVAAHRTRMRAHEKELMSGRMRSPSDLTKMSAEVEHMKAALVAEEDAELEVMDEVERTQAEGARLEAELKAALEKSSADRPGLEARISALRSQAEAEKEELTGIWEQIPGDYQAAYRRLARVPSPVAEVTNGQCGGCRVGLTPSELQQVRRGDHLVTCQTCSRILVGM